MKPLDRLYRKKRKLKGGIGTVGINVVALSGNLTRDAEIRQAKSGNTVVSFGKAVNDRRKNLSLITQDQINFLNQRNQAGGCRTMRKYYWKICGQEYDAQHPRD